MILEMSDVQIDVEHFRARAHIESQWSYGLDPATKWSLIKQAYALAIPRILAALAEGGRSDPYILDWHAVFTPIERNAWDDIRCLGLPLYPQFPTGGFFIDFADPYLKIGVELDGRQYHDLKHDRVRDLRLWHAGWRMFHLTGRESYQLAPPLEDNYAVADWQSFSSQGFFEAMGAFYYGRKYRELPGDPEGALLARQLIDFPLRLPDQYRRLP